ncbi:MAG: hypothetical protein ACR2PL_11525, partial [Dehalococcoidia bacterium]
PGMAALLAGGIAGYLLRRPLRAVLHALLPACVLAASVVLVGASIGHTLIGGAVAGILLVWLIWNELLLLLGAFGGGLLYALTHRKPATVGAIHVVTLRERGRR